MSRVDDLRLFLGEIERYRSVSSRIDDAITQLLEHDVPALGRNSTTAMAAAGLIETAYTSVETVFFALRRVFAII